MEDVYKLLWMAANEIAATGVLSPHFVTSAGEEQESIRLVISPDQRAKIDVTEYKDLVANFKQSQIDLIRDDANIDSFIFVDKINMYLNSDTPTGIILAQLITREGAKSSYMLQLRNDRPIDEIELIHLHDPVMDTAFQHIYSC
jgi:hypothetical protein